MKKKTVKTRTYEGLPVVDSDKDIILHIKPQDIKGSRKSDPGNCAAARACKREFGKETKVFITRIYVKDKNKWIRFITPQSVSREIISFDRGAQFEPGTYKVNRVTESAKLGYNRGKSVTNKPEKKTNPRPYHVTANIRDFDKKHLDKK